MRKNQKENDCIQVKDIIKKREREKRSRLFFEKIKIKNYH